MLNMPLSFEPGTDWSYGVRTNHLPSSLPCINSQPLDRYRLGRHHHRARLRHVPKRILPNAHLRPPRHPPPNHVPHPPNAASTSPHAPKRNDTRRHPYPLPRPPLPSPTNRQRQRSRPSLQQRGRRLFRPPNRLLQDHRHSPQRRLIPNDASSHPQQSVR